MNCLSYVDLSSVDCPVRVVAGVRGIQKGSATLCIFLPQLRHVKPKCGCLQVRNLRERLEEEHQALLTREQDKAALELRIARLTKLILHSTRITTTTAAARKQRLSLLRSFSEQLCPTVSHTIALALQPLAASARIRPCF